MAGWQPQQGATLLMPSGPDGDHLFVVLNDPKIFPNYGSNPQVLLVNLSSVRQSVHFDATCLLQPGCHPFVRVESYVVYRNARIEPESHLLALVEKGVASERRRIRATRLSCRAVSPCRCRATAPLYGSPVFPRSL